MRYIMFLVILLSGQVSAHQWTPTYPKFEPSYVDGIWRARMTLYNARKDISYFEISVFDDDWEKIPFATTAEIVKVPYLSRKRIDIHIREQDRNKVRYLCTQSKILTRAEKATVIDSRICSKIK